MKTGIANLPLHYGKTPPWLFQQMVRLAREIMIFMVSEFGVDDFLRRLSHPFWFQSLACVLGFDWHSSGTTTTTCGALKEAVKGLEKDLDLFICGGKGAASRRTPEEISKKAPHDKQSSLIYASKMSAKVDNNALQDGYQLYQHNFFFTSKGKWVVIQQGMNLSGRMARRYHWLSDKVASFVEEPQSAICGEKKLKPLNLVAKKSKQTREIITSLAKDKPENNLKKLKKIVYSLNLPKRHQILVSDLKREYLSRIFLTTYIKQPSNFEEVLMIEGLGSKTLRALTLIAELIYGAKPSYEDPVRYAFTHGGKDGIPYPLDLQTYQTSINLLTQAVRKIKFSPCQKDKILKRLSAFNYR